jgi:MOSC domain-containing protein YiiM
MRLVSVNVGLPRTVEIADRRVHTGIYKQPIAGPVHVGRLNLAGDGQADLRVHGGPDKAVYAYPAEHYAFWSQELGRDDLGYGFFGENLTTEGLLEDAVCIGDRIRVGGAVLEVSQPRSPCFKLALRVGVDDFVTKFAASLRTGFYLRVLEEGVVRAADAIERIACTPEGLSVREVFGLRQGEPRPADRAALQRAVALRALAGSWRDAFVQRLARTAGPEG